MMKNYVLLLLFLSSISLNASPTLQTETLQQEKKLTEQEVKQRGIDHMVGNILDEIDEIDIRKMARSDIFETPYGFRWKMVNLHTGKVLIVKVDKNFRLISVKAKDKSKASIGSL